MLKGTILGFSYGCLLSLLCVCAAGFGHGIFAPAAFAASPFCLFWKIWGTIPGFVAPPFIWAAFGAMVSRRSQFSDLLKFSLVAFYAIATFSVLYSKSPYADLGYINNLTTEGYVFTALAVVSYLGGQVFFWNKLGNVGLD